MAVNSSCCCNHCICLFKQTVSSNWHVSWICDDYHWHFFVFYGVMRKHSSGLCGDWKESLWPFHVEQTNVFMVFNFRLTLIRWPSRSKRQHFTKHDIMDSRNGRDHIWHREKHILFLIGRNLTLQLHFPFLLRTTQLCPCTKCKQSWKEWTARWK